MGDSKMIGKMSLFMAMVLPILAFTLTPSAVGQSYSGKWPVTVSHSGHSNGTYCVTLTDNGSLGWQHSGGATLVIQGTSFFGTFQLINGLLTATFQEPGGTGQNAGAVFIAFASKGIIGKGVYDQVYGGEEFDSGVVVFGTLNGC